MWLESEKKEIISIFSFLEKYDFKFEFLSFKKSENINNMNTLVSIIYKNNVCFTIKIYKNYPFEPICFYKLDDRNEINEIFKFRSSKEIQVYQRDLDLWKSVLKKNKFLSRSNVFKVVAESIKNQIKNDQSFYGISIFD